MAARYETTPTVSLPAFEAQRGQHAIDRNGAIRERDGVLGNGALLDDLEGMNLRIVNGLPSNRLVVAIDGCDSRARDPLLVKRNSTTAPLGTSHLEIARSSSASNVIMGKTIRRLYRQVKSAFGARALMAAVGAIGLLAAACSTSNAPASESPALSAFQPGAGQVTPIQTPPANEGGRFPAPAAPSGATAPSSPAKPPPAPLSSVSRGESVEGPLPAYAPPEVPGLAPAVRIHDAPPPGLGEVQSPADLVEQTPAPLAQTTDPISPTLRDLNPTGPKEINGARFMQLLTRDAIVPVYEPQYAPANSVELSAQDLVMGAQH